MGSSASSSPALRHAIVIGAAVILVALALRLFAQAYAVPSSSMEPALVPGDHLLVVRYLGARPQRGHVVVFNDGGGTARVKRVIGLPGDSVQIEQGHVLVNGEILLEESYAAPSRSAEGSVHVVPGAHYFLLGDNRDHSADSRSFGFVRDEAVVGRARLIYWSVSRSGEIRWSRLLRIID